MSLALKTELANMLPLLKEAYEQTQTKMAPLTGDKPEDVLTSKPIMEHIAKRLAGAERSDEKEDEFAEIVIDSLVAAKKMDAMWIYDKGTFIFTDHGTILLPSAKDFEIVAPLAFTARARLFCLLDVIVGDTTGLLARTSIAKLLPAIVAQTKEYCEVFLDHVKDPLF